MKYLSCLKRVQFVALVVALVCAVGIGVSIRHTKAVANDRNAELKEKFKAAVRDGIGSEVQFTKPGDDAKNVRASVESATQFMRKRSGVDLRGQTKTRLADMESSASAGMSRRITPDELSEIIATTTLERLSTASDEEINRAAETLKGFDAPDLPDSFRRGRANVRLRANRWGVDPTPEQFVSQVEAIRDADPTIKSAILKPMATRAASSEIQRRAKYLSESVPEQFGSATTGLTPLQAILIAYSTLSDDPLTDSNSNLRKRMEYIQGIVTKQTGQPYPSPAGHLAYGPNGYIYSTPLDIIFDEQTVNLLLDHIAERSGNQ
jgi:hypothetical protein